IVFLLLCISAGTEQFLSTKDLTIPVSLSEAKISPDGKNALFILTRNHFESNSTESALILADLETHQLKTLSRQKGITEPSWSPTDDRISFLASAQTGTQIFLLSIGQSKMPHQITHVKGGVLHHTWSHDGKQFAFIASDERPEKKGPERFNNSFEA